MTRPRNTKPLANIGPYELLEKVGSGGMGSVYRARDTRDGRIVALKLMHEHVAGDPSYAERFRREAAVAALIDSPNVVRVLGFASDGGRPYIVTEFIDGPGVDTLIKSGPLAAGQATAIAAGVANALSEASRRSIVHRDIKPGNILIGPDGVPKVTDFGIATLNHSSSLTVPGMFIGTAAYAAPEQHRGETDVRSDIYSLGVVLFEMVTGSLPFEAEAATGMMRKHEESPVPMDRLAGQDPSLVAAIGRCLEKQPSRRFQQPNELVAALVGASISSVASEAVLSVGGDNLGVTVVGLAAIAPVAAVAAFEPGATRVDGAMLATGEFPLVAASPLVGLGAKLRETPILRKALAAAAVVTAVTVLAMVGLHGGEADANQGAGGGRGISGPIVVGNETPAPGFTETATPSVTVTATPGKTETATPTSSPTPAPVTVTPEPTSPPAPPPAPVAPLAVVDWALCHTMYCPDGGEDLYAGYAVALAFELNYVTERHVSVEVWFDGEYEYTSNFTYSATGYYYDILPWANYEGELEVDVYVDGDFLGTLSAWVY